MPQSQAAEKNHGTARKSHTTITRHQEDKLSKCYFPIGILGQVWYLTVLVPDLCTLTYFKPVSWRAILHRTAPILLTLVWVYVLHLSETNMAYVQVTEKDFIQRAVSKKALKCIYRHSKFFSFIGGEWGDPSGPLVSMALYIFLCWTTFKCGNSHVALHLLFHKRPVALTFHNVQWVGL